MKPEIYISSEVSGVRALYGDLFTPEFSKLSIVDQLEAQAARLAEAHKNGDARCVTQISNWFTALAGASSQKILAETFSFMGARETVAREYGFKDWREAQIRGAVPPDPDFEDAVDALLAGDADALSVKLKQNPLLIASVSRYGHGASLLHYAAANGVETRRQVTPLNLPEMIDLLINAGADPNEEAPIYGGARPLGLLTSSAHPREAGVMDEAVRVLEAAGAR